MLGASLPREGTGNGLEVLSSTCQANVGSCRTCTPRRTDSEMSTSFAMTDLMVHRKWPGCLFKVF